jgi:hypothetical protein
MLEFYFLKQLRLQYLFNHEIRLMRIKKLVQHKIYNDKKVLQIPCQVLVINILLARAVEH